MQSKLLLVKLFQIRNRSLSYLPICNTYWLNYNNHNMNFGVNPISYCKNLNRIRTSPLSTLNRLNAGLSNYHISLGNDLISGGSYIQTPPIVGQMNQCSLHTEISRYCQKSNEPKPDKGLEAKKKSVFWDSRQDILTDLETTKTKMKVKVDEIIERENIYTIPNLLCVSRIAMSPYLCYCVLSSHYSFALGLFMLAGFTDLIDGMIARAFPSQASRIGSFLDPLADKILIASLFLTLTYIGIIPLLLTGVIVYRDVVIIFGASYVRYKSLPPPFTLSRYFDATHATAQLAPTFISKMNTAIQLGLITASLAAPVFSFTDHFLLHTLWFVTAVTTMVSGASYIFSKDTYKILEKNKTNSLKK